MKFIGFSREEEAEAWARKKLNLKDPPDFFRALSAVDDENNFVCVVVLTNFTSRNVDLNIAMDGSKMRPKATVGMFNDVFRFLFDGLHVTRVTGLSSAKNHKAHKAIEQFGFNIEGLMRKALPNDEDLLVYGMLAEDFYTHPWYRN